MVKPRLERLGARVVLTGKANRADQWGPCVDDRGRAGNRAGADLLLSLHADGSYAAGAPGFHVSAPAARTGGSPVKPLHRLARTTRAALVSVGLPAATCAAGGDGLDVRADLATLNLSRVPVATVELGNMLDPRDARRVTTAAGRAAYARGLGRAVGGFLG